MILDNPNFDEWILFAPIRPYQSLEDQISTVYYYTNPHKKSSGFMLAPMPYVDQTWCETPISLLNCVCWKIMFSCAMCEFD